MRKKDGEGDMREGMRRRNEEGGGMRIDNGGNKRKEREEGWKRGTRKRAKEAG